MWSPGLGVVKTWITREASIKIRMQFVTSKLGVNLSRADKSTEDL
jgi:hypothetical protein